MEWKRRRRDEGEGGKAGSFLENLPRGGKIEILGYEGGRGSIHGNMGLHAF